MSETLYCSLCGKPGVLWRNLGVAPYTHCPNCGGKNCQIEETCEDDLEDDEDETVVEEVMYVCQGHPRCGLSLEEANQAQKNGCIWCNKITVYSDGTEEITGPIET